MTTLGRSGKTGTGYVESMPTGPTGSGRHHVKFLESPTLGVHIKEAAKNLLKGSRKLTKYTSDYYKKSRSLTHAEKLRDYVLQHSHRQHRHHHRHHHDTSHRHHRDATLGELHPETNHHRLHRTNEHKDNHYRDANYRLQRDWDQEELRDVRSNDRSRHRLRDKSYTKDKMMKHSFETESNGSIGPLTIPIHRKEKQLNETFHESCCCMKKLTDPTLANTQTCHEFNQLIGGCTYATHKKLFPTKSDPYPKYKINDCQTAATICDSLNCPLQYFSEPHLYDDPFSNINLFGAPLANGLTTKSDTKHVHFPNPLHTSAPNLGEGFRITRMLPLTPQDQQVFICTPSINSRLISSSAGDPLRSAHLNLPRHFAGTKRHSKSPSIS